MRKHRKRQFLKTVRGPKLKKEQLEYSGITIAFYIANVLRQKVIFEKYKIQKQKNDKSFHLKIREDIDELVKPLEDYEKMVWSFEEIAAGSPNDPSFFPFKKLQEALVKKDKKVIKQWKKKMDETDESLLNLYNKKVDEGVLLFAENYFLIGHLYREKLQK